MGNKFIKVGELKTGDIFVHSVGKRKYVAFRLGYGEKPKIIGLTIPLTKEQLEKHFNIIIEREEICPVCRLIKFLLLLIAYNGKL